jgi:Asp-tRNA(Asn)/Glu-tRNA(Gln) amidotransferase C subunit
VQALNETIGKLNAEVAALKASAERSAKADASQLAKITDRVEKVEKAQAEPAAKLAKLSETVEKLRVAAATPAAPKETVKETTASIPTPVAAPNRTPEVHRLPTVSGWRIRDIANGGALIEGREGLYEVYAGDPLPGLGRVDAIRKQDGRWVVVTSKGLIVAR